VISNTAFPTIFDLSHNWGIFNVRNLSSYLYLQWITSADIQAWRGKTQPANMHVTIEANHDWIHVLTKKPTETLTVKYIKENWINCSGCANRINTQHKLKLKGHYDHIKEQKDSIMRVWHTNKNVVVHTVTFKVNTINSSTSDSIYSQNESTR
jgi:hypothetical protein